MLDPLSSCDEHGSRPVQQERFCVAHVQVRDKYVNVFYNPLSSHTGPANSFHPPIPSRHIAFTNNMRSSKCPDWLKAAWDSLKSQPVKSVDRQKFVDEVASVVNKNFEDNQYLTSTFKLSESATGVPSGSTAHLLLLQKPEKEQAVPQLEPDTKFEVLSTCPADEQPVPQLESDTGLASLACYKCCPGCGAKADFLSCVFCGVWMCFDCLKDHIHRDHSPPGGWDRERLR